MASDEWGPHNLKPDALYLLQGFAPGDERGQHEVTQGSVLEEEGAEGIPLDHDVSQRGGDDRCDEHGLARE